MKTWKLFLYGLFLIFPGVSSVVLRLYVCKVGLRPRLASSPHGSRQSLCESILHISLLADPPLLTQPVDDESYLLTDLRIQCNTGTWNAYTLFGISLVLLYPIGELSGEVALDSVRHSPARLRCSAPAPRADLPSFRPCMPGIPLFFFTLLRTNVDKLHEDLVKAQFGFLYAGYHADAWYVT
jgi:hypothetical protein